MLENVDKRQIYTVVFVIEFIEFINENIAEVRDSGD